MPIANCRPLYLASSIDIPKKVVLNRTFSVTWALGHNRTAWHHAQGARAQPTPNIRNQTSNLPILTLGTIQAQLDDDAQTWTKGTLVDHSGEPWFHPYLAEHTASRGTFIIPRHEPLQNLIKLPVKTQYISSPRLTVGDLPSIELRQVVHLNILGWKSWFCQQAVAKIESIQEDLVRDEKFASMQGQAHRRRRDASCIDDHVTLSMDDYSHIVRSSTKMHTSRIFYSFQTRRKSAYRISATNHTK